MDQLQSILSAEEQFLLNQEVDGLNKALNQGRQVQQGLGKDDFLKLLTTQLSHQNPMAPMEDREFIAQMAQFSSLEQMTSMAQGFAKLTSMIAGNDASLALGKSVEITLGERVIQGTVEAVTRGDAPQVLVNGNFYDWEQVGIVFNN
jgi:flagellar basal-body rod modification protein FlgD